MELSEIFNMMLQNPSVGFCAILTLAVYLLYKDFKSFVNQSLDHMKQLNETLVGLKTSVAALEVEVENVKDDIGSLKDK